MEQDEKQAAVSDRAPEEHLTPRERADVVAAWKKEQHPKDRSGSTIPRFVWRLQVEFSSALMSLQYQFSTRRHRGFVRGILIAAGLLFAAFILNRVVSHTQSSRIVGEADDHFAQAQQLEEEQKHRRAEQEYREAIRLQPASVRYRRAFAEMLTAQKEWPEAETEYRALLKLDIRPREQGLYHARLGEAIHHQWLGSGRPMDGSETEFREATRLGPENADYWYGLGEAAYWNKKYRDAEAAYRKAAQLKPETAQYVWDLGNALKHQQKQQESEAAYREAMRLDPKEGAYPWTLGQILFDEGRYPEAQREYEEAIRIEGPHASILCALADAYLHQGRRKEAVQAARQAIDDAYNRGEKEFEGDHKVLQQLGLRAKKLL